MQHDTVVIARKRWYCITMGWSRLLLVKRKRIIKTTTNNNKGFGHGWKPLMPMMLSTWMRIIDNLCEDITQYSLKQIHENGSCTCIMELFGVYIKFLRGGNGNLSTFWLSYMDMTEILLGLIRASREGDWMLHLAPESWSHGASHMIGWTMHAFSHVIAPKCLSFPHPIHMCTLNSCKEGFQFSLAPTTPSEESLSITRSKKQWTRLIWWAKAFPNCLILISRIQG